MLMLSMYNVYHVHHLSFALDKFNFKLTVALDEYQGITKVSLLPSLGTMNV